MYLPVYNSAMAALIRSSPGDKFFLPCCIIKHTLCAPEQAGGSPHLRTWELPSLEDLSRKVEDFTAYLFHNSK